MAKRAIGKVGRPKKASGDRYQTPARQLGRVTDEHWETIQAAAKASGKSFTQWALEILLKAAEKKKK